MGDVGQAVDDAATPWLDDDEQQAWRAFSSVVARLEPALDSQLRRDHDLRHFDYAVLALLSEQEDRTLRMSALADGADGSLSRLSQVVTRLERLGLVARVPDPDDGRATRASLTDAGLARVVDAAPSHVREVRRLVIDRLTRTQLRQLAAISERLSEALDDDPGCAGGP